MPRGRPPKPNQLKILHGDREDRINRDEPTATPGLGPAPGWLDELAREGWDRLAERLAELKVGTVADSELATLYATAYSSFRQCWKAVQAEGLTVKTESTTKAHPLLAQANQAAIAMNRILAQFGMTPVSRAGFTVPPQVKHDPLLDFMGRAQARPDAQQIESEEEGT